MKNISLLLTAVLLTVFISYSGFAQTKSDVPRTISYQGYLTDAAKHPLSGVHTITVNLYDSPAEGTTLHSESFTSQCESGVFSVMLGSTQALGSSLRFDKQYWLGVSIDGGAELSPRTALASSPYAIHASSASNLSKGATGAVTSTNGISGDIKIKGGEGTIIQEEGNTITISTAPNMIVTPQANNTVSGTTNQIAANGSYTAAQSLPVILTLPQNIHSGASPTFNGLTLNGKATSQATVSGDASITLSTKGYVDAATTTAWNINGNSGTSASNYLGTNDAANLSLRTSGVERMKLTSDGSLLLSGTSGNIPVSGAGTRMMWIPSLGAIRAGYVPGAEWDNGNAGIQSVAMGSGTIAYGPQSVAMGNATSAYGMGATAFGSASAAYVDGSTAFGSAAQAVGYNSVAMGDNTTAWGDGSMALGSNTNSYGTYSTAMGFNTTTTTDYGTAMGKNLTVGSSSFGFNGSTTNTTVNVSAMSNIAYFGDVDMIIGNDDNNARALRFYGKNTSSTLTSKYTAFKAGSQGANITYTLPLTQGSSGSVLTNNGSGTLSWVAPSISPYGSVNAGAAITIPGNTSVVKIVDDADSTDNSITLPSGSNGQIMYIYNNDSEPTSGDAVIVSGGTGIFIYADGWKKAN